MKYSYFVSFSYFDHERQTPKFKTETTIIELDFKLLTKRDLESLEEIITKKSYRSDNIVIQNISFLHEQS